jgi:hypothetical protein
MVRLQEGGVLTKKVIPALAIAFMLMAGGFLVLAADDGTDAAATNVVGDRTYVETGKTVTFTLSGVSGYTYEGSLIDSGGNKVSSTSVSGTMNSSSVNKTITAPSTAGSYRFHVMFFDSGNLVSEVKVPIKVVDPIVLKVTLKNTGSVSVTADVFFVVDGNRMEGSDTTVTIPAGGTKEITYNFVVNNFSGNHRFYVDSESTGMIGPIEGIGSSYSVSFHAEDSSYSWLSYLMLIIVIVMILILIYVYRKPVKNYGKPKGRR